jgi:hypothetical protein
MKLLLALCSLLAASSQAFMVRQSSRMATEVKVASPPMDEWNQPIPERVSTTPVPVNKVSKAQRARIADRIIDPDFTLALGTFMLGPLIAWYHPCKFCKLVLSNTAWMDWNLEGSTHYLQVFWCALRANQVSPFFLWHFTSL